MKLKTLLATLLLALSSIAALAQTETNIGQITVINLGDGRLLFRTLGDDVPLEGEHRIIDGYRSEYILAQFGSGMYNGSYKKFKSNKLTEEGNYKEGLREGIFKEYYSDGSVKSERNFANGKIDGIHKEYYTNGKPEKEKGYKNGLEHGIDRYYNYETGKLTRDCNYVDGVQDGKQMRTISSNAGDYVEISNYEKGKLAGQFSQTYTNGTVRTKGVYKNGNKEGKWIVNRDNGKPESESYYKNGERNGESRTFYTNGQVETVSNYVNNNKEGLSITYYYDSGKPKSEYNYVNNIKEGKYKLYYDDGALREEGRCESGKEVYTKEFYRNGQLKSIKELTDRGWETLERYNSEGKQL